MLSIRSFRRLWIGLGLSSLGDWLGLLALTAMASALADNTYADQNFAIAGVLFLRVLPAVVLGPLAGYVADRLDRRWTLIIGDILRGLVFVTIPIVDTLTWVLRRDGDHRGDQPGLAAGEGRDDPQPGAARTSSRRPTRSRIATTYGSALPAAATLHPAQRCPRKGLNSSLGWLDDPVTLALYLQRRQLHRLRARDRDPARHPAAARRSRREDRQGMCAVIREGWSYVAQHAR